MHVVEYLAMECEKQGATPKSVWDMWRAWNHLNYIISPKDWAYELGPGPLTEELIRFLGRTVEPGANQFGYRVVPAVFRNGNSGYPARQIERAIQILVEHQSDMSADEWYHQFETIHPFADGNGRVGSLIWNWMSSTIRDPRHPPDLWNDIPECSKCGGSSFYGSRCNSCG